ncbi:uncharacterized protein LOC132612805 [Lycium barbarum]|uniref:uncharacterized protein LOC132612805 n=1 Tax=Lycium barbarum TaxID=112863 RepID=UPI00293F0FCA|nr:uncharacterized protein LOC132612805 [Lycium barbarum]
MAIESATTSATVAATSRPAKFTNEHLHVPAADMPANEKFMIAEAWKQADFLCKGYILSALEDDLYNVYSAMKTSKELWDALEKKYKTKEACLKKCVIAKFLDYKMIDSRTVGTQVQELQFIFHDLISESMVVNEAFQVVAMIEKLPHSWKDFKNYLKHKHKEMKKAGHKAPDCRLPKKDKGKGQANVVEKNDDMNDLCAMLSECNLVGNPKEWWLDSGATRHVCAVKEAFATYAPARPEEELFMGNTAIAKIEGYGKILLKMTSGKVLTLNNVLHVPTIRNNLVSARLFVKNGFKCVLRFLRKSTALLDPSNCEDEKKEDQKKDANKEKQFQ